SVVCRAPPSPVLLDVAAAAGAALGAAEEQPLLGADGVEDALGLGPRHLARLGGLGALGRRLALAGARGAGAAPFVFAGVFLLLLARLGLRLFLRRAVRGGALAVALRAVRAAGVLALLALVLLRLPLAAPPALLATLLVRVGLLVLAVALAGLLLLLPADAVEEGLEFGVAGRLLEAADGRRLGHLPLAADVVPRRLVVEVGGRLRARVCREQEEREEGEGRAHHRESAGASGTLSSIRPTSPRRWR